MIDFLPPEARPHERAILIVYHILDIKRPKDIAAFLGYRSESEVYRALKKFRGIDVHFDGHAQQLARSSYIAPVGFH